MKTYCPNCDYPLYIVEGIIQDPSGNPIRACPNCLKELTLEKGEIKLVDDYDKRGVQGWW